MKENEIDKINKDKNMLQEKVILLYTDKLTRKPDCKTIVHFTKWRKRSLKLIKYSWRIVRKNYLNGFYN